MPSRNIIARSKAKAAVPKLAELLQNKDARVRAAAAIALSKLEYTPAILRMLADLVKVDRDLVSRVAADALGEMGARAKPSLTRPDQSAQ